MLNLKKKKEKRECTSELTKAKKPRRPSVVKEVLKHFA